MTISDVADANLPLLELSDIQAIILRPRPSPYKGEVVVLRIDDAAQGREMLRRIIPHVATSDAWWKPTLPAWLGIAFTFQGLKALGLSQEFLDSFPEEFRQGMAARAGFLNDMGANAPDNWEHPFGSTDVHVAVSFTAKNEEDLEQVLALARQSRKDLPKISLVYSMKYSELPEGRNPFGFKDGLHNPHVEGSGPPIYPGYTQPVKAGEFIMGYPDEQGAVASKPEPEVLRRNGTFFAMRKFHTDVAAFRNYLREQASGPEEEELIAAKMVGRWRSGAPLVLAPEQDDPSLGADQHSNDNFSYADDAQGLKCPFSAHIRRVNPRDALKDDFVSMNLHHFLRRGMNYGTPLPEGAMQDDGAERGGVFLIIGTKLKQQFEFVQSQWVTNGNFISHGTEQDPMIGNAQGDGVFTIPKRPVRRRLHGLPNFVTVRGGEYCFMPGLRALKWLADLETTIEPNLKGDENGRSKNN